MHTPHDDDMPAEIDFSKGVRGKFSHPDEKFNLRVYLDDQILTAPRGASQRQRRRSVGAG